MTAVLLAAPSWSGNPLLWLVAIGITLMGLWVLFHDAPRLHQAVAVVLAVTVVVVAVPVLAQVPCCIHCYEILPGVIFCWPFWL